jgi:malate dehydrogenase
MSSKYPYGPPRHKVCVLGASGGIGQPLAMLLKLNPLIADLALYDVKQAATPATGVAADLSHICTSSVTTGLSGDEELQKALSGSSLVVMVAGVPRKPGQSRDDLFKINAGIAKGLAEAVAKYAPLAMLAIITNPVNSTVPIACEILKKLGVFDWRRVVGVTALDLVRASAFVAEKNGSDSRYQKVPVIGGHAAETIVAVLSAAEPPVSLSEADVIALDKRIQEAGTEVVEAKGGAGSATLSMAYAGAKFTDTLLLALSGVTQQEFAYFNCTQDELGSNLGVDYFSGKLELGPMGINRMLPLPTLNDYEQKRLAEAKKKLQSDINNGLNFVNGK